MTSSQANSTTPYSTRRIVVALLALTLLAALLRTWTLADESPWFDEVISIEHLDAPTFPEFLDHVAETGTPPVPVYFALEYYWARHVSGSVTGLRMLSVVLSVLVIPAMFVLGRACFGAATGLFAAFFATVSLSQIYFGQEIRMYAPVPLFAAISLYTLVIGFQYRRTAGIAANIVCNALLAWTHPFAALLPLVQGLYVLAFARERRRHVIGWGAAHAVLLLGYAAWLRSLDLQRIQEAGTWMTLVTPSLRDFAVALFIYSGGRPINENPAAHLPLPFTVDPLIALVLTGLAAGACLHALARAQAASAERRGTVLLAVCAALPPVLLLALSWVWQPVFVYRYTLFAAIPWMVLAARGLTLMPRPYQSLIAAFLLLAYAWQLTALTVGPFRPDWRSATETLEQQRAPDAAVFGYQHIHTQAFTFVSGMEGVETISVWSDVCPRVLEVADHGRESWLLVVLWADPENFESCFREHELDVTTTDFESWPKLRLYRIAPASN